MSSLLGRTETVRDTVVFISPVASLAFLAPDLFSSAALKAVHRRWPISPGVSARRASRKTGPDREGKSFRRGLDSASGRRSHQQLAGAPAQRATGNAPRHACNGLVSTNRILRRICCTGGFHSEAALAMRLQRQRMSDGPGTPPPPTHVVHRSCP